MVFSGTDILKSMGILIAASILGYVFEWMGFAESNIIIVYVLAVLVISIVTVNRIYSLLASFVSVLVFNFLFTEPKFTLLAYDKEYPITFLIMFTAALLTSSLAAKLKNSAKECSRQLSVHRFYLKPVNCYKKQKTEKKLYQEQLIRF